VVHDFFLDMDWHARADLLELELTLNLQVVLPVVQPRADFHDLLPAMAHDWRRYLLQYCSRHINSVLLSALLATLNTPPHLRVHYL
jgi:hypothetical protein